MYLAAYSNDPSRDTLLKFDHTRCLHRSFLIFSCSIRSHVLTMVSLTFVSLIIILASLSRPPPATVQSFFFLEIPHAYLQFSYRSLNVPFTSSPSRNVPGQSPTDPKPSYPSIKGIAINISRTINPCIQRPSRTYPCHQTPSHTLREKNCPKWSLYPPLHRAQEMRNHSNISHLWLDQHLLRWYQPLLKGLSPPRAVLVASQLTSIFPNRLPLRHLVSSSTTRVFITMVSTSSISSIN